MGWTEWSESKFRDLNLRDLKVDQAYLSIENAMNSSFYLYTLSEDCVKCPMQKLRKVEPNQETVIKLNVARSLDMSLFDRDLGKFVVGDNLKVLPRWSATPDLGQFGVYDLKIATSSSIKFETAKQPVNIYTCKCGRLI
jgi:heparan-alpha-glucosaminide N-acetyltransferase